MGNEVKKSMDAFSTQFFMSQSLGIRNTKSLVFLVVFFACVLFLFPTEYTQNWNIMSYKTKRMLKYKKASTEGLF